MMPSELFGNVEIVGVPPILAACSRDNWNSRLNGEFPVPPELWPACKSLLLMGGCGVGKSHVAVTLLREYLLGDSWHEPRSRNPTTGLYLGGLFIDVPLALSEIQYRGEKSKINGDAMMRMTERVKDSKFVVFDECGQGPNGLEAWRYGPLMIWSRILLNRGNYVVFTTNARLADLGDQLASRLSMGEIIEMGGLDVRLEGA